MEGRLDCLEVLLHLRIVGVQLQALQPKSEYSELLLCCVIPLHYHFHGFKTQWRHHYAHLLVSADGLVELAQSVMRRRLATVALKDAVQYQR